MSADCYPRLNDNPRDHLARKMMLMFSLTRSSLTRLLGLGLLMMPGYLMALLPAADTGNLYVSMWSGDEVAVFSPDGESLVRFTTEGLDGPRGIAFHPESGEIWVAGELSDAVYIFDREHRLLRTLTHPDFNEPVGITFTRSSAQGSGELEAVVSNSNGNELMVFNLGGRLLRRFSDDTLDDPNCSAVMSDGSLFVANRLGGSTGMPGAVTRFDREGQLQFDFTTEGIVSLMAVARSPSQSGIEADATIWVSSGGGSLGVHEFDQSGNLLQSLLPADIDGGSRIVPQGLSVDDEGDLHVVSSTGEVLSFDATGQFLRRFDTGPGTPRSSAFAICPMNCSVNAQPATDDTSGDAAISGGEVISSTSASSSNGGFADLLFIALLATFSVQRRLNSREGHSS